MLILLPNFHPTKIMSTSICFTISTSQMALITIVLTLLASSPPSCSAYSSFKKIYAFGDSYTDTGNTKTSAGPTAFDYVSNPPYGVTYFHHPTNRYSDGRIVIDFVAEALSLPFLPPYRNPKADWSRGVNFAVGGGTAIRQGFYLKNNITFNIVPQSSLQNQLVRFSKVLESEGCKDSNSTPSECKAALDDALIWLGEIGSNDYTCTIGSSLSSKVIQSRAINSVSGFLQAIINKGAKYIIVQGLPATGCITYSFTLSSPEDRDEMGCVASMNHMTSSHNTALEARLNTLRKLNPQTILVYADYYNSHLTILKNAKKYGFKEQYKVCCGNGGGAYNFDLFNVCGTASSTACATPSEYINWDGAHFTEAVYRVMTDSFINGTFCSPPFHYLMKMKMREQSVL